MNTLNNEQKLAAVEVLDRGSSILLTSEAGCGKSFTLSRVIAMAEAQGKNIGVTAMTGSAALLIGGRTLHSFLGIGLAAQEAIELVMNVKTKNKKKFAQLRNLGILIIDEVSMLDAGLCDKISFFLQGVRGNTRPFGGLQVLFCGDLAQLKPVKGEYCFKSAEWQRLDPKVITLKHVYRQSGDSTFREVLARLRWGRCTQEDVAILKRCMKTKFSEDIEPTKIFSLNVDVDTINTLRFEDVCKVAPADKVIIYKTVGVIPKGANIAESITLCPGLQVLVTWNIPNTTLVNGTRAFIIDTQPHAVIVRLMNGTTTTIEYFEIDTEDAQSKGKQNKVRFMPLKLAYAVSVHRTQGMTLDCMEIDLGNSIFEYGQAYTALSRAKTLDSVRITKLAPASFKTHPDVVAFYTENDLKHLLNDKV